MIETEDESLMVKIIIPTSPCNLEKVACSPSIIGKLEFMSQTLGQTFSFLSKEGTNKRDINYVPQKSLPHLRKPILVKEYAHGDGLKEGIGGLF